MTTAPVPAPQPDTHPDQDALDRVGGKLDETLFVTAGAGSGKTRTLVTRLTNLVTEAGIPLRHIAAITFTEKAATELRERVRTELRKAAAAGAVGAADALEGDLDRAAIGTLHSFARRLLADHAVDAGLPPRIEVLDEVASTVAFEDRWRGFVDRMLSDPDLAEPLLVLAATNVKVGALRDIAVAFNQNWDLVDERPPEPPDDRRPWTERLDDLLGQVDDLVEAGRSCAKETDTLKRVIDDFADWATQVRTAADRITQVELLQQGKGARPSGKVKTKGARGNWPDVDHTALRASVAALSDAADLLHQDITGTALHRVSQELRRFTLDAVDERRRAGQLEFHDLLVMTRQLLRHPDVGPRVRAAAGRRYQRLLIDEFQDTDPIQIELAVLLATPEEDVAGRSWDDLEVTPGRLFFVGDPQQSIYRFRRADIGVFLQARDRFGEQAQISLTANHRSTRSLVSWFNRTFDTLMSEPRYQRSVARRPDAPDGPAVAVLGKEAHADRPRADDLRAREAHDVAAAVHRALADGWAVDRSDDWTRPDWQAARPGDIAILIPTRNSLSFLEEALDARGVPYRTESSSLVYGSQIVRDLLATLRAIDDPTDELLVVTALRSPLFACGDDDLLTFRHRYGGRFDHTRPLPDGLPGDDPVGRGLRYLAELHRARLWCTPSELLERVVRERRAYELAASVPRGRPRDTWHRLRFVTDQARAWSDATGGTLRQYLDWARRHAAPGARVAEAVLPETDDDAVRIMTVHAAKGLQFPVTFVAGLSTQPQRRPPGGQAVWPPEGPCLLTVGSRVSSPAYEAWQPVDEQMDHEERLRLLYVACTRARDHLVLSLHRGDRPNAKQQTSAEVLAEGLADQLDVLPGLSAPTSSATPTPPSRFPEPEGDTGSGGERPGSDGPGRLADASRPVPIDIDSWEHDRRAALRQAGRPRTVAATTLDPEGQPDRADDPGLQKRPRDLDLPPWRKGRYGTAIGRAVHGALQTLDLARPDAVDAVDAVDATVAAQASAEGLAGQAQQDHVRRLVSAALASSTVREAAGAPHWKEVHVAVPPEPWELPEQQEPQEPQEMVGARAPDGSPTDDGPLVEGYVDLLYRRPTDDRLVVVDYKTGPDSPGEAEALLDRYRLQGAAYAYAVGRATGEPVADVLFLFLTPDGPVELPLPDLETAVADVRNAFGRAVASPPG